MKAAFVAHVSNVLGDAFLLVGLVLLGIVLIAFGLVWLQPQQRATHRATRRPNWRSPTRRPGSSEPGGVRLEEGGLRDEQPPAAPSVIG
jgi:hypothetical protein